MPRFTSAASTFPRDFKHAAGHVSWSFLEKLRSLQEIRRHEKKHSSSLKEFSPWISFLFFEAKQLVLPRCKMQILECFLQSKNWLTLPADGFKHFD